MSKFIKKFESFNAEDERIRTSDIIDEFGLNTKIINRGNRRLTTGEVNLEDSMSILNRFSAMDYYNGDDYNDIKEKLKDIWSFLDNKYDNLKTYIEVSYFEPRGRFSNYIKFIFMDDNTIITEFIINFNSINSPYLIDRIDKTSWDEISVDDYKNK